MDAISLEENLSMRKNNALLAAAISATFVVSMNASYAGLTNYSNDAVTDATVSVTFATGVNDTNGNATTSSVTQSLVPVEDQEQGVIYATHLFGDTSSSVILPSGTSEYAAVVWDIDGTISGRLQIIASLDSSSGAKFSGNPLLYYNNGTDTFIPGTIGSPVDPCDGTSTCKWRFGSDDPLTTVSDGSQFYILYKIKSATSLGTHGNEVEMKVDLGTVLTPEISTETITVATGKDPFSVHFEGTDNAFIKVSVASDNTGFISQLPTSLGTDNEYIGVSDVLFGYMKITVEDSVKASNGYTDWNLGDTTNTEFDAGYDATNAVLTTLTINEEGQFAASTGSNGSVYLYINNAAISAISVTDTEAIWQLSNTDLNNIMTPVASLGDCTGDNVTGNNRCIPIGIKVDGNTQINIPAEDPPKAQLILDYATETNKQEIKYPGDDDPEERLTIYTQDGISCWVFNVPYAGAIDFMNLRIFNDSSTTALKSDGTIETECVHGTFYDNSGAASEKVALGCPPAGGVLYFNTANMAEKFSGFPTGNGRGTMFITSTLSKMEVLAMLRYKSPPCYAGAPCDQPEKSPLTNLSTGAHGVACAPDYR
jgi:hypothetical protein